MLYTQLSVNMVLFKPLLLLSGFKGDLKWRGFMSPIDRRQIIKKLDTEDFSLVSGSVCSKLMLEICEKQAKHQNINI